MIRKDYGVTFGAIADAAGIARSTLSRYNTGDAIGLPDTTTIAKIKAKFRTPLPAILEQSTPGIPGIDEAEISPLTTVGNASDSERQEWLVGTDAMAAHGLIKGDKIVARTDLEPRNGDVVVAQVAPPGAPQRVSTVLRRYHRHMGLAMLTGDPAEAPRLVDNATVVVVAVMTELHRLREPA